jgi:glyoxylase-like metal-dependent hydrolase (beta-lactamase superfamily II)
MQSAVQDSPKVVVTRPGRSRTFPVTASLAGLRIGIVNVYLYGAPSAGDGRWVLIDAALHGSDERIVHAAEELYGQGTRPGAIVLTHGHFDHVGALRDLALLWDVPIYAHELELPYLDGRSAYPPPDPTVGGGAMAALSRLYPRGPIDVSEWLRALPADGAVPGMPGWRWIHTPGHTPGHVSLYHAGEGTLLAGDAFVTTKQESMLAALTQRPEIHGPPAYYTTDWESAKASVRRLSAMEPEVAATGHGRPLRGPLMREGLRTLAQDFDTLAVPRRGRYVNAPVIADENGVVSMPPPVRDPLAGILMGIGAVVVVGAAVRSLRGESARESDSWQRGGHGADQ